MNRVGLKDYLLNHADDNDLLDCAKAWDAANEYGQFDTYSSVEEAVQANGWDAAQALSEARRVDQDADSFASMAMGISRLSNALNSMLNKVTISARFPSISESSSTPEASTNLKKSTIAGEIPSSSKAATVAMMVRAAESPSTRTSRKRSIHRLAGTVGTTSSPIVKSTKSGMKTDLCS